MRDEDGRYDQRSRGEPIFQLPTPLVALIGVLVAVELALDFAPARFADTIFLTFSFIPARFELVDGEAIYPGGAGALVWTFFTHALLHSGWVHLLVNASMAAALGRPVLERLGTVRFFALFWAATAAGAAVHLAVAWGSPAPMIGASGAVTGIFGGFLRFFFRPAWMSAASLRESVAEPRVRGIVLALVIMNVVLAFAGTAAFGGNGGGVAWGAHLGGFLVGFFGFALFDPPRRGFGG